jgi:N-glycosylase/DNA lyase
MYKGTLSLSSAGPFDLQATVESGQSYLWDREDDQMYEAEDAFGGEAWYVTVVRPESEPTLDDGASGPEVVRVRQTADTLRWEATFDADATLRHRLRLDDDLDAIRAATPDEPLLGAAFDRYWGMRLVRDPPFDTLISFIC